MKISVITATYNAAEHLPILINSLREQTDKDFEWVVADGLSTDATLGLLADVDGLNLTVSSEADFGIYDALNRGIKLSKGEFYLVVGADDYLYLDAIENFKKEISDDVDIVAACLNSSGVISKPGKGKPWLYGQYAYVAGHSAATIFRKSLHDQYGLYSRKFPIAADQYFIKLVCKNGARLKKADFVSGFFNSTGVSSIDSAGTVTESFRVQLLTERNKFLQVFLFVLRLLKQYKKL